LSKINDPAILQKQLDDQGKRTFYLQTELQRLLNTAEEQDGNHDKISKEMEKKIGVLLVQLKIAHAVEYSRN